MRRAQHPIPAAIYDDYRDPAARTYRRAIKVPGRGGARRGGRRAPVAGSQTKRGTHGPDREGRRWRAWVDGCCAVQCSAGHTHGGFINRGQLRPLAFLAVGLGGWLAGSDPNLTVTGHGRGRDASALPLGVSTQQSAHGWLLGRKAVVVVVVPRADHEERSCALILRYDGGVSAIRTPDSRDEPTPLGEDQGTASAVQHSQPLLT